MHLVAAAVAVPAGLTLVARAGHAAARAAAAVYVVSIIAAFGVSAAYHFSRRPLRITPTLRRLDHLMIYVLIAGTYTPVCVLGLPARWSLPVLAAVWAGALAGIAMKLFAFERRAWAIVSYVLYPVLGWAAVAAAPAIVRSFSPAQIGLVVLGYHEVWHTFTVAACVCHFAAVASLVG
jgi:hemolysin III